MWDIFNKEKVEALMGEVQRLKDALYKKNEELHSLDSKLSELNTENEQLTQQSEKFKQGIDAVLHEFEEFLIHNKNNGLNYDSLDTTRSIIDNIEDLNEYTLTMTLEFRHGSARVFRKRFYHYIITDPVINSYRFEIDQAININQRTETYHVILHIFTHATVNKIENNLINFLYKRRVQIQDHQIKGDKQLTINGYFRDTTY